MKSSAAAGAGRCVSVLPSERDVLWALDELGGEAGKTHIGRRMGVSSVYSELVCSKFASKGLIQNLGRGMYALTEPGEAWLRSHPPKKKKEQDPEKKGKAFEARKRALKKKWNRER